jgi:hypothetical protein
LYCSVFWIKLRAPHRGTSLGPFVCGARACSLCSWHRWVSYFKLEKLKAIKPLWFPSLNIESEKTLKPHQDFRCVSWEIYSRQQQLSKWGNGLHPRYAQRLTATESQHGLIKLAQHATHESAIKKTFFMQKNIQPSQKCSWRHIRSNPTQSWCGWCPFAYWKPT